MVSDAAPRRSWLGWCAGLVWVAWLGLMGLLYAMLRMGAWHPHFLPVVVLLGVMIVAGAAVVVAGCWRIVRGPRRRRALSWLLLGMVPWWFFIGHLLFGMKAAYGRQIDMRLPLKLLMPFGESTLDLLARLPYPQRTAGTRVVMIGRPVANARAQVRAMDEHVRALEARLGRSSRRTVHWVRGPLLGMGGKAIYGMCLGSRVDDPQVGKDGLSTLDRHEVAHCVLSQFCSTDFDAPSVLTEGWAEANSGIDPASQRFLAWAFKNSGRALSLRELTGPEWYGRHEHPAYVHGAVLVNHLLRKYGPERFLTLYRQCRRSTFAADCERILGASLDQIDADYWAEVDEGLGPDGYDAAWLHALELEPAVSPEAWRRFLRDYLKKTDRLVAPYANVRATADWTFVPQAENPSSVESKPFTAHYECLRSGPSACLKLRTPWRDEVILAHLTRSFHAERDKESGGWRIRERPDMPADRCYRAALDRIAVEDPITHAAAPLQELAKVMTNFVDPLGIKVVGLERFIENDRAYVRVILESRAGRAAPLFRSASLVFDAADGTVVTEDFLEGDGGGWRRKATYETVEGVPVLTNFRSEGRGRGPSGFTRMLTVTGRRFGSTPDDAFTEARLLGNDPVLRVPPSPAPPEYPIAMRVVEAYRWLVLAGAVSFVAGLAVFPWRGDGPGSRPSEDAETGR